MPRNTPIIAVFGSTVDETLEPAERLGRAIARSDSIVLTGGGREPDDKSVKEYAMNGAREAGRGARIGVLGKEEKERVWVDDGDPVQIIMSLGYGHRRNFVNAMMCDAAVAFDGGHGTTSEVAFMLAADRPVIVVGQAWSASFPIVRTQAAYDAFVAASAVRVPGGGTEPIDLLISAAYRKLSVGSGTTAQHVSLDHDPADIATLATEAAREAGFPGHFPDLPEHADIATRYARWLAAVEDASRRT